MQNKTPQNDETAPSKPLEKRKPRTEWAQREFAKAEAAINRQSPAARANFSAIIGSSNRD